MQTPVCVEWAAATGSLMLERCPAATMGGVIVSCQNLVANSRSGRFHSTWKLIELAVDFDG